MVNNRPLQGHISCAKTQSNTSLRGRMVNMKLVLSQSLLNDPKRRDIEQELVASLLMRDRIEVIIIEDLANLDPESTDALCIRGVRGDMLVVAWHHTQGTIEHLKTLGVIGTFDGETSPVTPVLPISLPTGQYDAMRRRIHCLDLNEVGNLLDARLNILTLLSTGDDRDRLIASPTLNEEIRDSLTHANEPVKPMPKRVEGSSPLDALDSLLDEMDSSNL